MLTLILFNLFLTAIVVGALYITKKYAHTENAKRIAFLIAPLVTLLCHYISFLLTVFTGGDAFSFLAKNPNLFMPAYPCNLVMWCTLLYGLLKDKETKLAKFLSDYIFWFGIAATLAGMFANMDYIANPTLKNIEVTKGIVAHAALLFNVLLIPALGKLRINFFDNLFNIVKSVILMFVIGSYCSFLFEALVSAEMAYEVNPMFIIHSPFAALPFLNFPPIAVIAIFLYAGVFTIIDVKRNPKGERWYNRVYDKLHSK